MARVIFGSAAETLEKSTYVVLAPPHAAPQFDLCIEPSDEFDGRPAFNGPLVYMDPDSLYQLAITIPRMLELFEADVSFEFTEEMDVLHVINDIDDYILEAGQYRAVADETSEYLARLEPFRNRVYDACFKPLLRRHPVWQQAYDDRRPRILRIMEALVPQKMREAVKERHKAAAVAKRNGIEYIPRTTPFDNAGSSPSVPGLDDIDIARLV